MKRILITGGTGLVGMHLSQLLTEGGYEVAHLSHSSKSSPYKTYQWNVDKGTIDEEAVTTCDCIVHLAGANVADGHWTNSRKQVIMDSRVKSAALLLHQLKTTEHHVQTFVSASAVGYYGNRGDTPMDEEGALGKGFLAEVCDAWEGAVEHMANIGLRLTILRTGVVLSTKAGALPEMEKPLQFHLGAYLGDGKQYLSWIHIDDLCRMYIKAIEDDSIAGIFNAVAPNPVRNKDLVKTIEKVLNITALNTPSPKLAIELAMGEMASMVLDSIKVLSQKIEDRGFVFNYPWLEDALRDLYERKV